MLRALYERFKRFLSWLNGEGYSGYSVRDAANYRRDMESRYGGQGSNRDGGGDIGGG